LISLDSLPGLNFLVSMQHPADQPIGFAIGQRARIVWNPAVGNRRVQ
jgi:hypothetical protein